MRINPVSTREQFTVKWITIPAFQIITRTLLPSRRSMTAEVAVERRATVQEIPALGDRGLPRVAAAVRRWTGENTTPSRARLQRPRMTEM
jgi:hypothetical protein